VAEFPGTEVRRDVGTRQHGVVADGVRGPPAQPVGQPIGQGVRDGEPGVGDR
jgi:hypothetical protein